MDPHIKDVEKLKSACIQTRDQRLANGQQLYGVALDTPGATKMLRVAHGEAARRVAPRS